MGLFDKVKKVGSKVLQDVTSEESKAKAKDFLGAVGDKISETAKEVATEENKEKAKAMLGKLGNKVNEVAGSAKSYIDDALKEDGEPVPSTPQVQPSEGDGATCREKLLAVIAEEFPQYTVTENLSAATLGGKGRFMPYSIAVCEGAKPVLFIMIVGKTTCSHREYRWAKEYAESVGVPMINFVGHYPNEKSYIVHRLHKYM